MVDQQPETGETLGEAFDRWLIEASPADFEQFLAEAPQLLSTKPVEFLRDCKARVDARLAAEPEKRVFSMSGPHEVRLVYWDKIAERLEAEINWRSRKSPGRPANSVRSARGDDPEVAKRRSIVKANRPQSAKELCKLFDFHAVCLPRDWQDGFAVKSWVDAYNNQNLKHSIQSLISRDKKATGKP